MTGVRLLPSAEKRVNELSDHPRCSKIGGRTINQRWLEYEKLAAHIYSELQPYAKVTHDAKISGVESGQARQFDVSIEATIAGHDLLIVVDAKDHKRPADLKIVEAFASTVKDVRASKGVLICSAGFTRGAKSYASNVGIDLCTLHDAKSRDWRLDVKIPLIWIEKTPKVNINMQCDVLEGDSISRHPLNWIISADGGKTRLDILGTFVKKWNAGELDRRPKIAHTLAPEQENLELLVGKDLWRSTTLSLTYVVDEKTWLGYFDPSECRGILDQIKGEFTPSYLDIQDIPKKRDTAWRAIADPSELVVKTKGLLVTSEGYQISTNGAEFEDASFHRIGP